MRSIIQTDDDKCFICQMAFGSEEHHIFPGNPNRRHSEEDGLKIRVCRHCHEELHCGKKSGEMMDKLQRLGQEKYEAMIGTREQFRERYGRSWL